MADIFDYLCWRGDIPFSSYGFCDADALVLSRLVYFPFDTVLADKNVSMTLAEALSGLKARDDFSGIVLSDKDLPLCDALLDSPRFSGMKVIRHVNRIDDDCEMQFSATIFGIDKKTYAVFFRGTDNTLVGWKEDFNMSFSFPVPSQKMALDYLETAARLLPDSSLIVGGHSKGGNLSVFASSLCSDSVKTRICTVYNLDGPGFGDRVLDRSMEIKTRTFVPQTSIVGMILGHGEKFTIIHSKGVGLMQHDLFSWQVERGGFETVETATESGQFLDQTLREWLSDMDSAEREAFTDTLFDILSATGAESFRDLTENRTRNMAAILRTMKNMNEDTRRALTRTISQLFRKAGENISQRLPGKRSVEEAKNS